MNRADRRHRTELTVARRTRAQHAVGLAGDWQVLCGHKLAKRHGMGSCSNRLCVVCAIDRTDKREKVKRARVEAHQAERSIE